jgi:hypothetical protein
MNCELNGPATGNLQSVGHQGQLGHLGMHYVSHSLKCVAQSSNLPQSILSASRRILSGPAILSILPSLGFAPRLLGCHSVKDIIQQGELPFLCHLLLHLRAPGLF